jgi:rod shape-determining protein MreD
MSGLRVLNTSIFLFIVFLIQETVISRIKFPIDGFSLYLAALMVLLSLEDRSGSIVFGFIGGLIMDLSIAADTPFGQWALILTLIGYLFSLNKESIGDFTQSPIIFIMFISLASAFALLTSLSVFSSAFPRNFSAFSLGSLAAASRPALLHLWLSMRCCTPSHPKAARR